MAPQDDENLQPDLSLVSGTDRTIIVDATMQLGCYRLASLLGRGGMGEVWKAVDTKLEREVALKLMRKELLTDEEAVKRFGREARAVARLNHPNIVQIYTYGEEKSLIYFVMELVDGDTVSQRLKRSGPIPLEETIQILLQTVEGLSYANARGIIHRDIKPSNLMITQDFRVKITDFGLAKMIEHDSAMTAAGSTMGSPNYMSPEQARGHEADHRSDIYSLGITFYQMVTGRLPFTADTPVSVLLQQIQVPLPEPEALKGMLGGRVLEVIKKMTAKDAEKRFQTYGGLSAAMATLAPGVRVTPSTFSPTSSMPTPGDQGPMEPPLATPSQVSEASTELADAQSDKSAPAPRADQSPPTPERRALRPPRAIPARAQWLIPAIVGATLLAVVVATLLTLYVVRSITRATAEAPAIPGLVPAPTAAQPTATSAPSPTPSPTPAPSPTVAAEPSVTVPPITMLTPTPPPTPRPATAKYVVLGRNTPPGTLVSIYDEAGNVAKQLPAGTTVDLVSSVQLPSGAHYLIAHQGARGYVHFDDATLLLDADQLKATPTAPPMAGQLLVLGAEDGSQKSITIFTDQTGKRELQKLDAGTEVRVLEAQMPVGWKIELPNGKAGFVYKGMAQPKQ